MKHAGIVALMALGLGCSSRHAVAGKIEYMEIRLSGEVIVGIVWKDPRLGDSRRFLVLREGDRIEATLPDGTVITSDLTLVSVVPDRVLPFTYQACPRPIAGKSCPGPRWVKSLYALGEVVLENGSGRTIRIRQPGRPPVLVDCCRAHEGTRPEPEKLPPPPRHRSEEELAWMLYWADQHWRSRNPKIRLLARDAYRTLVEDYRESEVVRQDFGRIAQRARRDPDDDEGR